MASRAVILVLDGVGVGALPDASRYGDSGSNTLAHVAETVGGLHLPVLEEMGLGLIGEFLGVGETPTKSGSYGIMAEQSLAKDSTSGHWEMMGVVTSRPFPTYPQGFPPDVIGPFRKAVGREILGNIPASGTEIIARLGEEHMRTGSPIVYTSADSVFQIAAHEDVVSLQELYRYCLIARDILRPPHDVGRVIARPFVGRPGAFVRTKGRRDFSLPPPEETLLDRMVQAGLDVVGIGKIGDIFAGRGLTDIITTGSDREGMTKTREAVSRLVREGRRGLVFTNLVDCDTLYGHRNDVAGFARALEEFDRLLPDVLSSLGNDDLLIMTADHGNDPTTESTDHSREYVPLLVYGRQMKTGIPLGIRKTFADLGQTLSELFGLGPLTSGDSFARQIL